MRTPFAFTMAAVAALLLSIPYAESAYCQENAGWETSFELADSLRSPRYEETLHYLRRLADASPWIRLERFGVSPQGRDLPLVILSRDGSFTPEAARVSGKDIVLIIAGIHSGEIDGKDAGMMLLRDIAVTGSEKALADNAVILFIPIFNVDGHERQSRFNRINQDGPEEMGWRVTAQNLNLNRDFMKADAPEMRAFLHLYDAWLPDMLVDCHVTDGMDFQYTITCSMEMYANAPASVCAWQSRLLDAVTLQLAALDEQIAPYIWPREGYDILSGMVQWAAPPRFSTGYAAVRNRAAMLIETHALKPYPARVRATYTMLRSILHFVNATAGSLRTAVTQADEERSAAYANPYPSTTVPLVFDMTDGHSEREFLGWKMEYEQSTVSGSAYPVWHHEHPETLTVPLYDNVIPTVEVLPPHCYLLPQEWQDEAEILRLHNVHLARLTEDRAVPVETYVFEQPEFRDRPYEGRFTVRAKKRVRIDTVTYPAGTYVVFLAQPSSHAAVHLLEPDSPDSFLQWGFFNAIFEQKEYYEQYAMERVAAEMLAADPALRREFDTRLQSDTTFAASPRQRLDFFYERSPYYDRQKNVYPVSRCLDGSGLPVVPEQEYRRTHFITE
jgi:hypothetical protein